MFHSQFCLKYYWTSTGILFFSNRWRFHLFRPIYSNTYINMNNNINNNNNTKIQKKITTVKINEINVLTRFSNAITNYYTFGFYVARISDVDIKHKSQIIWSLYLLCTNNSPLAKYLSYMLKSTLNLFMFSDFHYLSFWKYDL